MADVRAFNRRFAARGLCLLPLRLENGHALLYLYRPAGCGAICKTGWRGRFYPRRAIAAGAARGCVTDLVRRLRGSAEFPHEIGLFLSYPPEDVRGFIENRAQNFKRGTLEGLRRRGAGRALFRKFKKCTQIYCERWQSGQRWTSWPSRSEIKEKLL